MIVIYAEVDRRGRTDEEIGKATRIVNVELLLGIPSTTHI